MKIEKRKRVLKTALVNSFVDDYKAYKKTIEFINQDLINLKVNFQYSYDQFCIDFLDQTMKNVEDIDIFKVNEYNQFYIKFWQFNLYTLHCMLSKKFEELGYEYSEFYNKSNMKQKINDKYYLN